MRLIAAAGLAGLAIAAAVAVLGTGARSSPAADAAPPAPDAASPLQAAVARGDHRRLDGPGGPIHVWRPAGYRAETAATVVYVHGHGDDADTAWRDHQLAAQFALSAVNAVFVVPEAPRGSRPAVHYPDLGALIRTVEDALGEPRPSGPLIVVGHSGAYRTLEAWIDYPPIDTVILVDALYGDLPAFRDWLAEGPARRLVTIGDDTLRWTEDQARAIADTVVVDRVPPTMELWPATARTARHLYVRSQFDHMAQVTAGVLLPMLLRLEAVELLGDAPWDQPFGVPPPAGGAR